MSNMKTLLAFAAALLAASACSDTPTQPRGDNDTLSTLSPADGSFSRSDRVEICHRNEDGSFELITVAGNAVGAHLAHGDSYPFNGSCGEPSDPPQPEEGTETGGDTAAANETSVGDESGSDPETPSSSGGSTNFTVHKFSAFNQVEDGGFDLTGSNNFSVSYDASSPGSPGNVLQVRFPKGLETGTGPGTLYHSDYLLERNAYFSFYFKVGSDADLTEDSRTNKVAFLNAYRSTGTYAMFFLTVTDNGEGSNRFYLRLNGQGLEQSPNAVNWVPNQNAFGWFPGSQWVKVEGRIDLNTPGVADGRVRLWVNGKLTTDYSGIKMVTPGHTSSGTFSNIKVQPTWGSDGDTIEREYYFWYDDLTFGKAN
jgi:hypothetical protein